MREKALPPCRTEKSKAIHAHMLDWCLLSITLGVMICLFAPLQNYLLNQNDFWFSLGQMVPVLLASFFIVAGILFALGVITMNRSVAPYIFGIYLFLLIAFYIQGNYIPREYGLLTGVEIDWGAYPGYAAASIGVWLGTFGIVSFIALKFRDKLYNIGKYISIFLLLIQCITLGTLLIQNKDHVVKDESDSVVVTSNGMLELSNQNNILVFVLDTFDSSFMQELLDGPDGKEYQDLFSDFTYYPDTLGMYQATRGAMPHLLTGVTYENVEPYAEYVQEAYSGNDLYAMLGKNQYSVGVYTSSAYLSTDISIYENVIFGRYSVNSHWNLAAKLMKLTSFQYMPHQLKRLFFVETSEFESLKKSEDAEVFQSAMQQFDQALQTKGISTGEWDNCLRIYHLDGTHAPYTFGKNLLSDQNTRYTHYDEAEGICTVLSHYFDMLKSQDLYDCSTIILMGDHGDIAYRQNPVFMIKNVDEHHEFEISDAGMSYDFFSGILKQLISGEVVDEGYIYQCASRNGPRRFLWYSYQETPANYLNPLEEYQCYGSASDPQSLIATGKTYWPIDENSYGEYKLGTELSFLKEHSNWKAHRVGGIAEPEEPGSWTDSKLAKLRFKVDEDYENLLLDWEYETYLPNERVIISVNDQLIADYYTAGETQKSIIIPGEYIPSGQLELSFEFPDAIAPMELHYQNQDIRKLALLIKKMKISSTPLEANLGEQINADKNRYQVEQYILGEQLSFSADSPTAIGHCISGFATPETGFCVSLGYESVMRFIVDEGSETLELCCDYFIPTQKPQTVRILVNGHEIADFVAEMGEQKKLRFSGNLVKEGIIELMFIMPDAVSPKELGINGDTRILGLAMKNLSISAVKIEY